MPPRTTTPDIPPQGFHSYWLIGERLVRLAFAVIVGAFVARYLGPADFGRLSFAQSVAIIGVPIAALGLKAQIVKWIVRQEYAAGELLHTCMRLRLVTSSTVVLLVLPLLWLTGAFDDAQGRLVAICLLYLVPQTGTIYDQYFLAYERGKTIFMFSTAGVMVANILRVAAIYLELPVEGFAALFVAEQALKSLFATIAFFSLKDRPQLEGASVATAKSIVGEAYPLIMVQLVGQLLLSSELIFLRIYSDAAQLGLFAAASRVTSAYFTLQQSYIASVYPRIVRSTGPLDTRANKSMVMLFEVATLSAVTVAAVVTVLAYPIGHVLFGAEFAGVGAVISIHVWAAVPSAWRQISGAWLQADTMLWRSLRRSIGGLIALAVVAAVLIPPLGAVGAAITTLVVQFVTGFGMDWLGPKTRKHAYAKIEALRFRQTRRRVALLFRKRRRAKSGQ